MPKAEWRLFLPNDETRRQPPPEARTLLALFDHVPPVVRTDVYLKADADLGVKRRGDGGLELKALKNRQMLGGGVGPGLVETFEKIKLGVEATPTHVLEHLREKEVASGSEKRCVSAELKALMSKPVEVSVKKSIRKIDVPTRDGMASFEATEVLVTFSGMPEAYPKDWITFCAEGSMEAIEAFLAGAGKPLVALFSHAETVQVGYPQFIQMISTE